MQTTDTASAGAARTEAVSERCAALRAHLEAARRQVLAAIRAYPSPITACDAQFNHLLEQRERIAEELRRLDALCAAYPEGDIPGGELEAFLGASPSFDDAERRRMRAILRG